MKKGPKISPIQTPRTKEQIIRDEEVARKRKIVVEEFYPALIEATISIDESKMLLQAATSLIMEEVLNTMKERTLDEIYARLVKKLCPEGIRQLQIEKWLETVRKENLYVARELIEGATRAIAQMLHDEEKNRKLDTLNPEWDKYLN